ncbi:MAG TPA: hypothetical protein VFS39_09415, partial [Nitrospira sp.]|nr:hypothetical protein [Nitrospira sp.]
MTVTGAPTEKESRAVDLAERVKAGQVRAVSRLISLLENHDADGAQALDLLTPGQRPATVIGVTGYPGAGKS